MKRISILFLAFLLVAGMASAAEVRTAKGTNALLLTLGGLSDLNVNTFDGGVGFRYYMQDRMALRPALNFLSTSTTDASNNKTTTTGVGGTLTLEKHLGSVGPVSPYVGVGAGVDYSKTRQDAQPTDYESKTTSFFGFVPVGFEWAFADGLSLGGEYHLAAIHDKTTVRLPGASTDEQTSSTRFGVMSANSAALILSVAWR